MVVQLDLFGSKAEEVGTFVIIPETVKSPLEEKSCRTGTEEWLRKIDIWTEYVTAISRALPDDIEKYEGDANNWRLSCELLKEHRDNKEPVEVVFE